MRMRVWIEAVLLFAIVHGAATAVAEPPVRPQSDSTPITQHRSENASRPKPYLITDESTKLMEEGDTFVYAANAMGDNGYATGQADPVLLRIASEPELRAQALILLLEKNVASSR